MTVNEFKETTCATAGPVDKMELKVEEVIQPLAQHLLPLVAHDSEVLLGRVLAGNFYSVIITSSVLGSARGRFGNRALPYHVTNLPLPVQ